MTPTRRGRSHKGSWPSCSHPSGSGQRRSGHCAAAAIREARVDIIDISSRMPGDVIAHRKMTRRHIPAMSKACAADKAKRDQHDLCVGNRKAHPRRPCARRADRLPIRRLPIRRRVANAGRARSGFARRCRSWRVDNWPSPDPAARRRLALPYHCPQCLPWHLADHRGTSSRRRSSHEGIRGPRRRLASRRAPPLPVCPNRLCGLRATRIQQYREPRRSRGLRRHR